MNNQNYLKSHKGRPASPVTDHLGNSYECRKIMYDTYGITESVYSGRIRHGWTIEKALTTPIDIRKRNAQLKFRSEGIKDHLNNHYSSRKEMCQTYGITLKAYERRIERGWSLEKTLTTPMMSNHHPPIHYENVSDHLGNIFPSIKDMCAAYQIKPKTYNKRKRLGWSTERALTEPLQLALTQKKTIKKKIIKKPIKKESKRKPVTDHLNNKYLTQKEMCEHYGINVSTYRTRIQRGWSVEDALCKKKDEKTRIPYPTAKIFICEDHLGNKYLSITEMCKKWNIPRQTYQNRIGWGWSVKDALTTPSRKIKPPLKYGEHQTAYDHLNNEYINTADMCNKYGITLKAYYGRINRGWSLEKTLTTPMGTNNSDTIIKDHLGNVFSSKKEMCNHYGITVKLFDQRRFDHKWSLEKTLTTPKNVMLSRFPYFKNRFLFDINGIQYYGCTCKICNHQAIMTRDEMVEHQKQHKTLASN